MDTLPKTIVLFGLELGASLYIGIGVYGSVAELTPPLGQYLTVWSSLLFGAGLIVCIRGICRFGTLRARILAREEEAAESRSAA